MFNREWLDSLSEGDPVVVVSDRHAPVKKIVTRTTAAHIIVGDRKYRRKDGRPSGGKAWTSVALKEPTEDLLREIDTHVYRRYVISRAADAAKIADEHDVRMLATLIGDVLERKKGG